jgi:hypothetical protein
LNLKAQLERLMKSQKLISIMKEVTEILSLSGEPQHICDSMLDTFIKFIPVDACWIQLLSFTGHRLEVVSHRALTKTNLKDLSSLQLGSKIDGQSLDSGGSIIISDLTQHSYEDFSSFLESGFCSLVLVSLRTNHIFQGFLGFGFRVPTRIDKDFIALASVIGNLIWIMVDRSKIEHMLNAKANVAESESHLTASQEQCLTPKLKENELLQTEDSDINMTEFKELAKLAENYSKAVQNNIQRAVMQAKIPPVKPDIITQVEPAEHGQEYKKEEPNSIGSKEPVSDEDPTALVIDLANRSVPAYNAADIPDRVSNQAIEHFKKHNLNMIIFRKSHA